MATNSLVPTQAADLRRVDRHPEAALASSRGRAPAQRGAPDRRRVAALGPRGGQRGDHGRRAAGRTGVPIDRSTTPPGWRRGHVRPPRPGGRRDRAAATKPTASAADRAHDATNCRNRARPGLVEHDVHDGGPLAVRLVDHLALAVHGGQHVAPVEGDDELDHPVGHPQPVAQGPQQLVDPLAGAGRDHHRPVGCASARRAAARGARSALLTTSSSGTSAAPISSQHGRHRVDLRLGLGRRRRPPRGRAGRPPAPPRGWSGTPRPAGGAACARTRRCRTRAPSRRRGGPAAGCGGRGSRTAGSRRARRHRSAG